MKICSFSPALRVGSLAVLFATAHAAHATPEYEVINIGNLPGATHGKVVAINNNNVVAGTSWGGSQSIMFRWSEATGMDAANFPGSSNQMVASDINDAGVVVGGRYSNNTLEGFRDHGALMISFAPAQGFTSSFGSGINNFDEVVGSSFGGGSPASASRFPIGWGTLLPKFNGQLESDARRINDAGDAVGYAFHGGTNKATLFRSDDSLVDLHSMIPGADWSHARDINDSGKILGEFGMGEYRSFGFLLNFETGLTIINPLPGRNLIAMEALNAHGHAVGLSATYDSTFPAEAILWRGAGDVVSLNTLIDPSSGWLLDEATGINDHGYIVGTGRYLGIQSNFLLKPVPEPGTMLALALGVAALARRKKTRV